MFIVEGVRIQVSTTVFSFIHAYKLGFMRLIPKITSHFLWIYILYNVKAYFSQIMNYLSKVNNRKIHISHVFNHFKTRC